MNVARLSAGQAGAAWTADGWVPGSGPYDRRVDPLLAALLGALAGALAASVILSGRRRRPVPPPAPARRTDDLRHIVRAVRSAAVVVGRGDEIVAHNPAALTEGIVRGDRIGIPALLDLVRAVRRTGEPADTDLEIARPGREPRRLAARVLRLDDGRVFCVVDDRAPMLRVEEATRDFLANATHELKTPLGAVSLLAEALEQASDDEDAVRRFAGRIGAEVERLNQLVGQIILLSRLQGHVPAPEPVDVDRVVARALDRNRELAERRAITLTTGGVRGLSVSGDADQLATAVSNLVQNAIAYSDPRGRVVVTTRAEPDAAGVAIAVSDNGIGIAAADTERIFERFYRVDYARSRESGGTGLGLSIVSEVVSGHGGTMAVWSKPGSGSTFTITLPRAQRETPHREGEA